VNIITRIAPTSTKCRYFFGDYRHGTPFLIAIFVEHGMAAPLIVVAPKRDVEV
jgi:hypothetical protein